MPVSSNVASAFANTVADDTARLAITLTTGMYNKQYLQLDNGFIYRVTNVSGTPSWVKTGEVALDDSVTPVPDGGTVGQALIKQSSTDGDVAFDDITTGLITDFTTAVNALVAAGITSEVLQDLVGPFITDSADLDWTYDDAGNAVAAILKTSGVVAGTYGDGASIPVPTIDAKGRITGITTVAVTQLTTEQLQDIIGPFLTDSSDLDFTYDDAGNGVGAILKTSGVTAASYGAAGKTVSLTIDAKGRITVATEQNVAVVQQLIQGVSGGVIVANGIGFGPLRLASDVTFNRCDLQAVTAPTGAALILDVKRATTYGGTYTTIFSAAPQIAATANTGSSTSFSQTTANAGDYLRFDVTQIGSTVAGSNLSAQLVMTTR